MHGCTQVGSLSFPNPMIMAGKKEHASSEENDTVESLLLKLVSPQNLVGEEREIEKGRLSQEFWHSHNFFSKPGVVRTTKSTF